MSDANLRRDPRFINSVGNMFAGLTMNREREMSTDIPGASVSRTDVERPDPGRVLYVAAIPGVERPDPGRVLCEYQGDREDGVLFELDMGGLYRVSPTGQCIICLTSGANLRIKNHDCVAVYHEHCLKEWKNTQMRRWDHDNVKCPACNKCSDEHWNYFGTKNQKKRIKKIC